MESRAALHLPPGLGLPIIGKLLNKHVMMFSRSLLDGAQTVFQLSRVG
jgi:hypothetical protein